MLVEDRRHPRLAYVVKNVMHFLGSAWRLQIFCTASNHEWTRRELGLGGPIDGADGTTYATADGARVVLTRVRKAVAEGDGFVWEGPKETDASAGPKLDKKTYTEAILAPDFWRLIVGEHVVLFQLDCLLLRRGIDAYLQYDFIGAAWDPQVHPKLPPWGQNGGLSLRKRSVMLAALRRHPPLRKINEAWEPSGQVAR